MKKHIKNYTEKYGQDNLLCEVCGKPANDLHHIFFGRFNRSDETNNIIALCRTDHLKAHFQKKPYLKKEELLKIVEVREQKQQ
jgi:5-methylcytosine-specific restriction endonuclease McrA